MNGFNVMCVCANTKLKDLSRIRYIIEQHEDFGRSFADIARELGISRQRVHKIYTTYRNPV